MLLSQRLDESQAFEDLGLEVAVAVHGADGGGGVAVAAVSGDGGEGCGGVVAGEEAAGERVVDYDVDAVFAAAGDQFGFYGAGWWSWRGGQMDAYGFGRRGLVRGRTGVLMALYMAW